MTPRTLHQVRLASVVYALALGVAAGWWLHEILEPSTNAIAGSAIELPIVTAPADRPPPQPEPPPADSDVTGHVRSEEPPSIASDPIAEIRRHRLRLPIGNADVDEMEGGFSQRRNGNRRAHEAVDLLAPRGTPVLAVEDGTIARLFSSRNGGITVYQFDPTRRFCYYYAHLDGYADGLREGQKVSAGGVIGFVGTTGNAPPDTPHLHFAIFELNPNERWWEGTPIDPYLAYSNEAD